jgi:sigma-E factor negative regulatory protein RseA
MSQQIREQLSALMDGELPKDETAFLLRRLTNDRTLLRQWSNYHLGRQALRRQELVVLRADFADTVLTRIGDEPLQRSGRGGHALRWISGGAIAASVAVFALMFSGPRQGGDEVTEQPLAALPASPVTGTPIVSSGVKAGEVRAPLVSPVIDVQPASVSSEGFSSPDAPMDPRLQSYLIRHYDAAGDAGQSGLMPYVLLIVPTQQQAAAESAAQANPEKR